MSMGEEGGPKQTSPRYSNPGGKRGHNKDSESFPQQCSATSLGTRDEGEGSKETKTIQLASIKRKETDYRYS